MKVTVKNRQNLWDVCLQHTGTIEGAFDLALANELSLTDDLAAGQLLEVPDQIERDVERYNYYQEHGVVPATALTPGQAG